MCPSLEKRSLQSIDHYALRHSESFKLAYFEALVQVGRSGVLCSIVHCNAMQARCGVVQCSVLPSAMQCSHIVPTRFATWATSIYGYLHLHKVLEEKFGPGEPESRCSAKAFMNSAGEAEQLHTPP